MNPYKLAGRVTLWIIAGAFAVGLLVVWPIVVVISTGDWWAAFFWWIFLAMSVLITVIGVWLIDASRRWDEKHCK